MRNLIALLLALVVGFITSAPARADGWVRGGHVDGPHTDLLLSPAQVAELKKKDNYRITLNQSQIAQLVKKFPGASAVKTLRIYVPKEASCSCEIVNVALRVGPTKIEVADAYLGRCFNDDYWRFDGKSNWQHFGIKKGVPEIDLFLAGREAYYARSFDLAVSNFRKVLQRYPKFLPVKYYLSSALIDIGDGQKYDQNFEGAKKSYAEAKMVADDRDWRRQDMIAAKLKSVEDFRKESPKALSSLLKHSPSNFDDPGVWKGSSYIGDSQRFKLFISKVAVIPQTFTAASYNFRVGEAWLEKALRTSYSSNTDCNRQYNFVCFPIKIDARSTSIYRTARIKLQLVDKRNKGVLKDWYTEYESNHVYMMPVQPKEREITLRCLISTTKPGKPENFVPTDVVLKLVIP